MCEAVEKYGDNRAEDAAIKANVNAVSKLVLEMEMSLDQALDFLVLNKKQRILVAQQLQKSQTE